MDTNQSSGLSVGISADESVNRNISLKKKYITKLGWPVKLSHYYLGLVLGYAFNGKEWLPHNWNSDTGWAIGEYRDRSLILADDQALYQPEPEELVDGSGTGDTWIAGVFIGMFQGTYVIRYADGSDYGRFTVVRPHIPSVVLTKKEACDKLSELLKAPIVIQD